jgi:molybdopterin-guanine dinucleotide biosynthesis protein A
VSVPKPDDPLRAVVVLAGGGSRRLGHDKLGAALGDTTVLDTLLDAVAQHQQHVPVVVVGPQRSTRTEVSWRFEDPPGGGPVAGLAAGIAELDPADVVGVVAGDQPFAAPALSVLLTALRADELADAAIGVDPGGRDQPLLGVYRVAPLHQAIGDVAAGRSVRSVVGQLAVVRVPLQPQWCLDVDTAADLAAVRASL